MRDRSSKKSPQMTRRRVRRRRAREADRPSHRCDSERRSQKADGISHNLVLQQSRRNDSGGEGTARDLNGNQPNVKTMNESVTVMMACSIACAPGTPKPKNVHWSLASRELRFRTHRWLTFISPGSECLITHGIGAGASRRRSGRPLGSQHCHRFYGAVTGYAQTDRAFYPKASPGLPKCTNLNGPKFPTTRDAPNPKGGHLPDGRAGLKQIMRGRTTRSAAGHSIEAARLVPLLKI
jgi:hypothetical protein